MAEASEHWSSFADRTDVAARDNLRFQGDLLLVHVEDVNLAHLSVSTKSADSCDCRIEVVEIDATGLLSNLGTST